MIDFPSLPFEEAIAWALSRGVVLPDVYYGQLQGYARAAAFSIAGISSITQLHAVKEDLLKAQREGADFATWKKQVSVRDLALPAYRIENIFRTNIQGEYARGRCEQQRRNVDTHPYLLYDAVNDSRTRPAHAAMDGLVARVDDPIWDTWRPPCGYQCRCRVIALSEREADKYIVADQRRTQEPDRFNSRAAAITSGPDTGWDYDVCKDPAAGIKKATAASPGAGADPILQQRLGVMDDVLGKGKAARTVDDLTDEEWQDLRRYSESGYDYSYAYLNTFMREGDLKHWGTMNRVLMEEKAHRISSTLNSTQLQEPLTLYRGTALKEFGLTKENLKIGDVLVDKAPMSMSVEREMVQDAYTNKYSVILEYAAPAEERGLKLYAAGKVREAPGAIVSEMEVLLAPSKSFVVDAIEQRGAFTYVKVH